LEDKFKELVDQFMKDLRKKDEEMGYQPKFVINEQEEDESMDEGEMEDEMD
jgi:hypothetical protein